MTLFSVLQLGPILPPSPIAEIGATTEGMGRFIQIIISLLIIIAGLSSFIMLLVAGIQWSTSGGDEKAAAASRGRATAAIIGLVLTLSAYAIIRLLEYILGASIISGGISLPGP